MQKLNFSEYHLLLAIVTESVYVNLLSADPEMMKTPEVSNQPKHMQYVDVYAKNLSTCSTYMHTFINGVHWTTLF